MVFTGMRAAWAATYGISEDISLVVAAGANNCAVIEVTPTLTSPPRDGFVTGTGESGVSVQGPQVSRDSGADCGASATVAVRLERFRLS